MTYVDYISNQISQYPIAFPIYIRKLAEDVAKKFNIEQNKALAATSVAVKRIMNAKNDLNLKFYQKGIYYRTIVTPFGERGIDMEKLIADKYILPDKGYETGLSLLHRMGLATQMPRKNTIATNVAKDCLKEDKKLGVFIRPPKVEINSDNIGYLQTLDALELLEKAPIDTDKPYEVVAEHIHKKNLAYDKLLYYADNYYGKNTVMQIAHTASAGGCVR